MTGKIKNQLGCKVHSNYFLSLLVGFFLVNCCFLKTLCWADSGEHIWYADTNTGIQKCIDEAFDSGGGTVFIRRGLYILEKDPIFLKEGISLIGDPPDFGSVEILGQPDKSAIWADSNTIIRNLVIRNAYFGIRCHQDDKKSNDITIANNLIVGNEYGIYIKDSFDVVIINNTIAHNEKSGLFVFVDPNDSIFHGYNNIFALNDPDCGITFAQQDEPDSGPANFLDLTTIPSCLSYNDFFDIIIYKSYNVNGERREMIPISPEMLGSGNFSGNPYFVNPNKEDFRLMSYSTCIDKGDPNSDFSKEPFPNGGRINLGFYGNTPYTTASIDSDDDGIKDFQEGIGDVDEDGIADWQDRDTAIIPLPWSDEKIFLFLQDMNRDSNQTHQFKDVQSVLFSEKTFESPQVYAPFEAIQFRVTNLDEGETILVGMLFPEDYEALEISQYMFLSSDTSWQSLPFEIDPNKKAIIFKLEDGQVEDRDGIKNGIITHLGCMVIPRSITLENPGSCFISLSNLPNIFDSNQKDVIHRKSYSVKNKNLYNLTYEMFLFLRLLCLFPAILFIYCLIGEKILGKKPLSTFLILLLFLFLFFHGQAQAQEDIEFTSSPNPVGSGARALGMGGAFISVADDATAASWNPAGLKHLVNPEVSFVEKYSSRSERYRFEKSHESAGEYCLSNWDVNYFSMVFPGRVFKRNFVISLNYQHLYDFSKKLPSYSWKVFLEDPYMDIAYQAYYEQSGGISAFSPALAFTVTPRISLGLTVNIYSNKFMNNEWIKKYHKDGQGKIDPYQQSVITHVDILDRYTLSGHNYNLGLLWDVSETFTLGMVYKTPFKADLDHTNIYYKIEKYPQTPSRNMYKYDHQEYREELSMPRSYGFGLAYQPLDPLVIDLDIYRTEWEDYELTGPNGKSINPITGFNKAEVTVKPTYQIRLGAEYAFITKKGPVPTIRGGIFYDPAPAPNKPDDYYGVSLGLGLTLREKKRISFRRKKKKQRKDIMSIDVAYQYRWGRKVGRHTIKGEDSPTNIAHHLVYISLIYYIRTGINQKKAQT